MQLFSHLVIAQRMQPYLMPDDLPEYYWGAVAADVRYFAGLRRRVTHPALEVVRSWQTEFPDLNSFVLGYRVHTLADERDSAGSLYDGIPLRPLRRKLPRRWAVFLMEAVYTQRCRFDGQISGSYNPLLERLGVLPDAVAAYINTVKRYAAEPSLDMAMKMLSEMGWANSTRLKRSFTIAGWLLRKRLVRWALPRLIDEAAVTRRIIADLRAHF